MYSSAKLYFISSLIADVDIGINLFLLKPMATLPLNSTLLNQEQYSWFLKIKTNV